MHASGHMRAQWVHPVQSSGLTKTAGWKPRLLRYWVKPSAFRGQTETHRPQPLQISSSMMMLTRAFVRDTMSASSARWSFLPFCLPLPGRPHDQ